jgi:hypothetical protein
MTLIIACAALALAVFAVFLAVFLAYKMRRDRRPRIRVTLSWHEMMPILTGAVIQDIAQWRQNNQDEMPPWCAIFFEVRNKGYVPVTLHSLEICQPPIEHSAAVEIHGWQKSLPNELLDRAIPRGSLPQEIRKREWLRIRIDIPWLVSILENHSDLVALRAKAVDSLDKWHLSRKLLFKPQEWREILAATQLERLKV